MNAKTIRNYTCSTPATLTISYIEAYLAEAGALGITKEIEAGSVKSLFFHIQEGAKHYTIKLPAKVNECQEFLWRDYCSKTARPRKTRDDFKEQAQRTAWKIVQEWTHIQISMVKMRQIEPLQAFMSFIWDGGQTYYEFCKTSQFKALPAKSGAQ